jgi:hypothetical protein
MVHICDFYSTFVTLAGGDPTDPGGPSPLDSLDQSEYIMGASEVSARTVMVHDHYYHGGDDSESGSVGVAVPVDVQAGVPVTLQTFYTTSGGCHEHFGNPFNIMYLDAPVYIWGVQVYMCILQERGAYPTGRGVCPLIPLPVKHVKHMWDTGGCGVYGRDTLARSLAHRSVERHRARRCQLVSPSPPRRFRISIPPLGRQQPIMTTGVVCLCAQGPSVPGRFRVRRRLVVGSMVGDDGLGEVVVAVVGRCPSL